MELCARTLVEVRVARSPQEIAEHHAVRAAVFVHEQGIFAEHDRDAWDDCAIKAIATISSPPSSSLKPCNKRPNWPVIR